MINKTPFDQLDSDINGVTLADAFRLGKDTALNYNPALDVIERGATFCIDTSKKLNSQANVKKRECRKCWQELKEWAENYDKTQMDL